MKKLTLALALVLCLVLAFASCGNKKTDSTTAQQATEPAATTAAQATDPATEPEATQPEATQPEATQPEATQPGHVHVPEADYWIDYPATCLTPGQKSLYCEECGEQIPESITEIPVDPTAHDLSAWTIIEEATLFADGKRSATCTICKSTITETYSSLTEVYYSTELKTEKLIVGTNIYNDILEGGGKHFYPTQDNPLGNDLFAEYSLLWNSTLDNLTNSGGTETISARVTNAKDTSQGNDLIWMSLKDHAKNSDCPFAGGFEYGGLRTVENGPVNMSTGTDGNCHGTAYSDFPNIGGADQNNPEWGWHRIGIRLHQELTNEEAVKAGENATYLITVECFIDGVSTFKFSNAASTVNGPSTYKNVNYLFTATSDGNGGITYADIDESKYILTILSTAKEALGDGAFFVYGDYYATAGDSFVQNVTRVDNPAANVYTTSTGAEIPAPFYYQLASN